MIGAVLALAFLTPDQASPSAEPAAPEAPPVELFEDDGSAGGAVPVVGQPATVEARSPIELQHRFSLDLLLWPGTQPGEAPAILGEMEYRPRAAGALGRRFRFAAEPIIRAAHGKRTWSLGTTARGGRLRLDAEEIVSIPERQFLGIKELFLATRGAVELAAGWQIVSWSRADGFRPLDVFQRADMTDRLRDETLGIPAVTAAWQTGPVSLDAVWAPVATVSRVPYAPVNVWATRPPGGVSYRVNREGEPPVELSTGEAGLRIAANTARWDAALVLARAHDREPSLLAFHPGEDATPELPTLVLEPRFQPYVVAGGNLAVPLGPMLARLESGYFWYTTPAPALLDDGLRAVLGLEVRRGFGGGRGSVFASVQYLADRTTPGAVAVEDGLSASPFHVFRHAVTASMILEWGERLELSAKGLADLQRRGRIGRGELRYKIRDGLVAWLGGDVLDAGPTSWLGAVNEADRILVGLDVVTE